MATEMNYRRVTATRLGGPDVLQQGKIQPIIAGKFPILAAASANALLESGTVVGNVVLVAPALMS